MLKIQSETLNPWTNDSKMSSSPQEDLSLYKAARAEKRIEKEGGGMVWSIEDYCRVVVWVFTLLMA